jgi:hypothetical protein
MKMRKEKGLEMTRKMTMKVHLKRSRKERSELAKLSLKRLKNSQRSQQTSRKASGTLM